MAAEMVAGEFEALLRRVEVEFQNSLEEITLSKDLQKLSLPTGALENLRAGSRLRVFRWVAEKLIEKGIAKPVDEIMDRKNILKLRWKEKNNPSELQPLPEYFYLRTRDLPSNRDEILPDLMDIHALRLGKLMNLAAKRISPTILENLTAEEKVFYQTILSIVNVWLKFIEPKGDGDGR